MTSNPPIPLPSQVPKAPPVRQLSPGQEGRLRIVTSILDRDRDRSTDDLIELLDAVLDDEEDEA